MNPAPPPSLLFLRFMKSVLLYCIICILKQPVLVCAFLLSLQPVAPSLRLYILLERLVYFQTLLSLKLGLQRSAAGYTQ